MSVSDSILSRYLVVPGQVIVAGSVVSSDDSMRGFDDNHNNDADDDDEDTGISHGDGDDPNSFLRGHGTHLTHDNHLLASCTGLVQRVNKLISVERILPTLYEAHTGDLVLGRITAVGANRWSVQVQANTRQAVLPLSGVHLPGGVQRIRTAQDAREMRVYLQEGDLVSAEVHKVQQDRTVFLHTRSFRYGKLENGCLVVVPTALVPRRKNHYLQNILHKFDVLLGCNGMIWMQRKLPTEDSTLGQQELAELQEQRRVEHAQLPYTTDDRQALARLRNAVECLRLVSASITPEAMEEVYMLSVSHNTPVPEMLWPQNVLWLTATQRTHSKRPGSHNTVSEA